MTPLELTMVFGIGGTLGMAATTEVGAALLPSVGAVVGGAVVMEGVMTFTDTTDKIVAATNRQELEQPAKELGEYIAAIPKELIIMAVGLAGGAGVPKVMPKLTNSMSNGINKLPPLEEATMVTPEGVPVKGIRIKPKDSPLEKVNNPMENSISSKKANEPHIKKGDNPPYGGIRAQEIVLKQDTVFVRVHGPKNQEGVWLMRQKDVAGLTAQQIKDKFALPKLPTHISEVFVPTGTKLTVGRVAPQESWGSGGGIQYELEHKLFENAYKNMKELK